MPCEPERTLVIAHVLWIVGHGNVYGIGQVHSNQWGLIGTGHSDREHLVYPPGDLNRRVARIARTGCRTNTTAASFPSKNCSAISAGSTRMFPVRSAPSG